MRIDHSTFAAMHPKSIASTSVLYNGAAAASANGIPVSDATEVRLSVHVGAVSVSQTGIAIGLYASPNSTNVSSSSALVAVDNAIMAITKAKENSVLQGRIQAGKIPSVEGYENDPHYLYVKYAQETADAVLVEAVVETAGHQSSPVDPVEGTTAFVFDI